MFWGLRTPVPSVKALVRRAVGEVGPFTETPSLSRSTTSLKVIVRVLFLVREQFFRLEIIVVASFFSGGHRYSPGQLVVGSRTLLTGGRTCHHISTHLRNSIRRPRVAHC